MILGSVDPSASLYWLSSRAAGTAALLFASASVFVGALRAGGLAGSAARGSRRRLELAIIHEALGLATIVALLIHGFVLMGDNYLPQNFVDIAIPFVGPFHPVPNGIGIISGYVFMVLSLTYYLRDRFGEARWKAVHRLVLLAWVGSIVHTLGEGTDREQAWFLVVLAVPAIAALVALGMRVRGPARSEPAAPPGARADRVVHEQRRRREDQGDLDQAGHDPEPARQAPRRSRRGRRAGEGSRSRSASR